MEYTDLKIEELQSQTFVQTFFRYTYLILAGALLTTGITTYFVMNNYALLKIAADFILLIVLVQVLLVLFSNKLIFSVKVKPQVAGAVFILYSIIMGVLLAPVLLMYEVESIMYALFFVGGAFGLLSMYAMTTERSISNWQPVLYAGLGCAIAYSMIALFIEPNNIIALAVNLFVIALFFGFIIYDIHRLKMIVEANRDILGTDTGKKLAIYGAFTLYVDIINILLRLIRIFGKRR